MIKYQVNHGQVYLVSPIDTRSSTWLVISNTALGNENISILAGASPDISSSIGLYKPGYLFPGRGDINSPCDNLSSTYVNESS